MERDCFCPSTSISLFGGLSVYIKDMKDKNYLVLGFCDKQNGLIPSVQSNFLYKGKKECVEIKFEDGRTIKCTENHKLLDSNNIWIEAKNLKINDTRIKTGIVYPVVNFEEEILECKKWKFKFGNISIKTDNHVEFLKSLAFCRIVGYLIMDGTITENNACIRLGHLIDVNMFLKDLSLFQDISQKICKTKNHYTIYISKLFLNNILKIEGITIGKKVDKELVLPSFILDDNCPTPLIREFLAGMFGGDGHTCVLGMHRGKRDTLTSVAFSKSRKFPYLKSLVKTMNDIKNILAKRFDINNVSVQNLKENTYSKKNYIEKKDKCYQSTLLIQVKDLNKFTEKIGFRYCCHKNQRLCAGNSYHEYKKINKKYLTAEEYIKNIGVTNWFLKNKVTAYGVDRTKMCLPTMNLKVISIKNIGIEDVYDIQVDETHSFLANGIVAHNCMIAHGVSRFLKERLFEKSDPYTINICDDCGNIATSQTECKFCNGDKISRVGIPYASKLLILQLMAMQIKVKFSVKA